MLTSEHPDVMAYRKDPDEFVRDLYGKLKASYSSLYIDQLDDVVVALKRLDLALHEGYSAETLLTKIQQASALTSEQFRTSCAKFVKDFYWRRNYVKPQVVRSMSPAKPYNGPRPERP